MNNVRIKLLVGGLVLFAAVALLAVAGVRGGLVSYREVDEVLTNPALQKKRIRVAGTVLAENCNPQPVKLYASFAMAGKQGNLPVVYKGSIPDNFKQSFPCHGAL